MKGMSRAEIEGLRQAMLLGTSRRALMPPPALQAILASKEGVDPSLYIFALAGQQRRFERPSVALPHEVPQAAMHLHRDPLPILPAAARRAFMRLLDIVGKDLATVVIPAAMRRVTAAGMRLHPFDLPRLVPHLKASQETLGIAERAFLALAEAPAKDDRPDLLSMEITAENWIDAPKSQRRLFLRRQRMADPAATRALIESALPQESAAGRADLLRTLVVRLGPDDVGLIESFARDRSNLVREAATFLLARVRGTPDHAKRLGTAAQCFQRKKGAAKSLLSMVGVAKSATLAYIPPPSFDFNKQLAAVETLFEGISLPDIAGATGCTEQDILDVLPEDDVVFWAFHATAMLEGDTSTQQVLTEHQLMATRVFPEAYTLVRLVAAGALPVSVPQANSILASERWSKVVVNASVTDAQDFGQLVLTAALLPTQVLPQFRSTIAGVSPVASRLALAFADIVAAIAADRPSD
jgi:hypothetical protein